MNPRGILVSPGPGSVRLQPCHTLFRTTGSSGLSLMLALQAAGPLIRAACSKTPGSDVSSLLILVGLLSTKQCS